MKQGGEGTLYDVEFRDAQGSQVILAVKAQCPSEAERISWAMAYESKGAEVSLWTLQSIKRVS